MLSQWLTHMVTKDRVSNNILDTVLLFLRHPLLPEGRMLCLLYLLARFILQAPQVQPKFLSAGLSLVKNYYLWPRPFGDFARSVLEVITLEARSPGAPLRNQILRDYPMLLKDAFYTGK